MKSVTYRPTLSTFRGGPIKKNTLYLSTTINDVIVHPSIKPSIVEDEPKLIVGGVLNLIEAINIGFLPRVLQASLRRNQVTNQHLKRDFFLESICFSG